MEDGQLLRKILVPHWWDMSPLEAKIFIALYWFADPDSGEVTISLLILSRRVNVSHKEILPHLEKLKLRGLIDFVPSKNSYLDSRFKILSVMKKNQVLNNPEIQYLPLDLEGVNDNDNNGDDNDFKKNRSINVSDKRSGRIDLNKTDLAGNVNEAGLEKNHSKSPDSISELTPEFIAINLNDMDNLPLYKAYFNRYPREVISRAYQSVIKTPRERIKKSPGAYFTFLVKKYGNFN